jgi:Fe-S cluster biogenesis protein NfuA
MSIFVAIARTHVKLNIQQQISNDANTHSSNLTNSAIRYIGQISGFKHMSSASPVVSAPPASELRERIQDVINLIRPAVQADGGDIELVDVLHDGVVHIRFHGACNGCPSSTMTLHSGIERNLRERVPQVTKVLPVP